MATGKVGKPRLVERNDNKNQKQRKSTETATNATKKLARHNVTIIIIRNGRSTYLAGTIQLVFVREGKPGEGTDQ